MPNGTRQAVIDQAFSKFDKHGCGVIDVADLGAEWNDYYASVSANIDNDNMFCPLMVTAWRM